MCVPEWEGFGGVEEEVFCGGEENVVCRGGEDVRVGRGGVLLMGDRWGGGCEGVSQVTVTHPAQSNDQLLEPHKKNVLYLHTNPRPSRD